MTQLPVASRAARTSRLRSPSFRVGPNVVIDINARTGIRRSFSANALKGGDGGSRRGSPRRPPDSSKPSPQPPNAAADLGQPLLSADDRLDNMSCLGVGVDVLCELDENDDPRLQRKAKSGGFSAETLAFALSITPFFFWGSSMPIMKMVLPHTTTLVMASLRLLPSGLLLVAWAASKGRPHPRTAAAWAWICAFAIMDGAAFQWCLAEGLSKTNAGLGSVIIDSQPLTVACLAAVLFGDSLGTRGMVGLALGVVGLLCVEIPYEQLEAGMRAAGSAVSAGPSGIWALVQAILASAQAASADAGGFLPALGKSGAFWMLCAAQCMAIGTVMVRFIIKHCDPVHATGYHMLLGGTVLLALAEQQEPGSTLRSFAAFTPQDFALLTYVSLLGGAASYGVFFWNASQGNLAKVSSLTFLTPVFAVATGWLLLGEQLNAFQFLGAGITLGAVSLIVHNPAPVDPVPEQSDSDSEC